LITKIAEDDDYLLNELSECNVKVLSFKSNHTTTFKNIYSDNIDTREQIVEAIAEPFEAYNLSDIYAKIFHLGPLTKYDIPADVIEYIASKTMRVSLDVQGLLREVEDGHVKLSSYPEKKKILRYVDILKADATEIKLLAGIDDIEIAAKRLSKDYDISEIIVTLGSKGSLIYFEGNYHYIPAFLPDKIVDPTGCGDTYIAGYISQRLVNSDVVYAGMFASVVAGLKIGVSGGFKYCKEDVLEYMEKFCLSEYSIYAKLE
jgi:sugar/nucleoside kinase (ribokinase family)